MTANLVERMLESGELGDPLPPERVLAGWLGVSRLTLRWGVDRLVANGRLRREQGRGAYGVARPRLWPAARLGELRGPLVVLAIDDPDNAAKGWPWRVWLRVARLMREWGARPVVMLANELLHVDVSRRVHVIVPGDRVAPEACLELLQRYRVTTLARATAGTVWNIIDVDWSDAIEVAIEHVGRAADDRFLVMFERRAKALDAQRWFESLIGKLTSNVDVIDGGANESAAYLSARRYLREGGRPTVVFADEDLAAAGAMRAMARTGFDAASVRVVGRGGTRVAQYARPRITSLTPPIDAIAEMVVQRIERDEPMREPLTMVRASCLVR